MATFKDVYKAGDGYSPVRLFIKNTTERTFFYDFKGVTDAFGNKMKDYSYQTSLYSTYQTVRNNATSDSDERNAILSPITSNPATGFLKAAYYTAKAVYKGVKDQTIEEAMKQEAYVTNYRAGFIIPKTNLYIEMGSIPVDGTFNNKGWAQTADTNSYKNSYIGPADNNEQEPGESARLQGVGVKFWGETTGLFTSIRGDFFNFNINLVQIPETSGFKVTQDTNVSNQVQSNGISYLVDGGGINPRTDFINITIL